MSLDIVDISQENRATADLLLKAASTQGFLVIEGHDFTELEVGELFALSQDFFKTPVEDKMKFPINDDNCGYTKMGSEKLDDKSTSGGGDPKESFYFSKLNLVTGQPSQLLPPLFEANIDKISDTVKRLHIVVRKILKLLAISLDIDASEGGGDWFCDRNRPDHETGCAMRFLYYPSLETSPEELVRAGAHTDYGSITLLFQHESLQSKGLEIFSPITKKWEQTSFIPASPKFKEQGIAPPLVVNIGDELSYWTNGYLKSTIHRVRFTEDFDQDRYSIVFFSQAETDVELTPIPSEKVRAIKGRGASHELETHGKVITSGEYLRSRLKATYKGRY